MCFIYCYLLSMCHVPCPVAGSGDKEVGDIRNAPALEDFAFHWGTERNEQKQTNKQNESTRLFQTSVCGIKTSKYCNVM